VYPVAFLFLDIPLDEVDVNVHPAKTEVRFRRGEAVKDVVAEAVREALMSAGITGDIATEPQEAIQESASDSAVVPARAQPVQAGMEFDNGPESRTVLEREVPFGFGADRGQEFSSPPQPILEEVRASFEIVERAPEPAFPHEPATVGGGSGSELPPVNSARRLVTMPEVEQISTAKIRPLGQLHDSFIIAVDDEGLLLIDQHVAHERILFDKFRRGEIERTIESQNLLLPETIDLSPAQSQAFQLIEGDLAALGFGLMSLSGRTIAIKSVPTDLPASEARNLFAEILDSIDAEKKGAAKSTFRNNIAASLACKAAIKINMKLTPEKMRWLIDSLLLTTSPTTCPHGRPVILRLTMKDIERGFHRT
jgi:DNA mismatch repair protein MutL